LTFGELPSPEFHEVNRFRERSFAAQIFRHLMITNRLHRRPVLSETERQIVIVALDMIVEDRPLSQVADELNRRGHTTREGNPWTPSALFTLLPRMIQVGPKVFRSEEWVTRKQRLPRVV